jgi:two-component system OmpR family sensor kinase
MPTRRATRRSRCGRSTRNRAGRVAASRSPHCATPSAEPAAPRSTPATTDPGALYTSPHPGRPCRLAPAGAVAPADPVGAPTATPRWTTPRAKTRHHLRPPAAPTPRTAATHSATARHMAATPPHTPQPTTPTAPTPHSTDHHVESPATPGTHTPTPPRPTDPTRDANQLPQQADPPPRSSPPASMHPALPTPAPRLPTSSPSHPRVCAATPTTTPTLMANSIKPPGRGRGGRGG